MAWIYLGIAALFEAAWTFSLKYLDFKQIKAIGLSNLFSPQGAMTLVPLLGYIIFGIGNIYFFAMALKLVPTAVAMAIWTALTLIFIKFIDIWILHEKLSWAEIGFMLLITIGIIGLKVVSK